MPWDSPLSALADLVAACADVTEEIPGGGTLRVTELVVETPLEMVVSTAEDGSVELAASPPRQAAATTVMPVLHRIRLRAEVS